MKTKTNRSSAKRLIIILSLSLALLIAVGAASYAWIRNYIHVNNLDLQTGKMEYNITLYRVDGDEVTSTVLFDTKNDPENKAESVTTEIESIRKDLGAENSVIDVTTGDEVFFVIEKYDESIDFDVALSFDNEGIDEKYSPNYAYIGQMNYKAKDDSAAISTVTTVDALKNYLKAPGENTAVAENLGKIWKFMQKTEVKGDQKYACIRLELNDNENAVSADLEGKAFPLRVGLCVAQHGALPDEDYVDKYYVDDETTLKNALNNYGAGDEIYITKGVVYTGDMVFTRPCKLIVMHSTLTINGNLIYTYMYGGNFVLNTVTDGHIVINKNMGVGGNLQIDLPDTSLDIVGANNEDNADIYVAGSFTANASKADGQGIFFKGARICEAGAPAELKPLLINGPARISVSNRTSLGSITTNGYCRRLIIENGGYIQSMDLTAMDWDSTLYSVPSILIDNSGTLGDTLIKLPEWSRKFIDSDDTNNSANDNTQIKANKGSGELRAITKNNTFDDTIEDVENGEFFFSTGKMKIDGYRDDIEYALREHFIETVGGSKDKIIIHYETPAEMVLHDYPELAALTTLQSYVDFYLAKGEISAANELKEVKIICYGEKALTAADYEFIRNNMKASLTTLDLSDAVSENRAVPDDAFRGMSALVSLKMSESDTQWGKYIFTDTGIDEITFPQSLKKLDNSVHETWGHINGNQVLNGIKYVRTSVTVVEGLQESSDAIDQYFFTPDEHTRTGYQNYFKNPGVDWYAKFFVDNGAIRYGEFFIRYDADPEESNPTCELVAFTGGYVTGDDGKKNYVAWTTDAYNNYAFDFNRININGRVYSIESYDPYAFYDKLKAENAYELVIGNGVKKIGDYAFASSPKTEATLGLVSVEINGDPEILGYSFAYNDVLESFNAEKLTALKGGYNLSNNSALKTVYMPSLKVVEGGGDISTCSALERVDIGVVEKTEANKTFYTSDDGYSYARFYIHTEHADAPSFYRAALAADSRHIFVKESYADLYRATDTYTGLTEMGENDLDALIEADIDGNSLEAGEELAYYYVLDGNDAHLVACLLKRIDKTGEDYTTIESLGGHNVTYIGSAAYHFTYMIAQNIKICDTVDEIGGYAFASNKLAFKKYCVNFDLNNVVKAGKGAFYYMDMIKVIGDSFEEVAAQTFSYNQNLMVVDLPNLSRSRPAGSTQTPPIVFERCSNLRAAYIGFSDNINYDDAFSRSKNYIRFVNFVGGPDNISVSRVNTVINSGSPYVSTTFQNSFTNSNADFSNIYFSNYYTYEKDWMGLSVSVELPGYIYRDKGNGEVELIAVSPDIEYFGNYSDSANGLKDYYSPGALYVDGSGYTVEDNGTEPAFRVTSIGKHAYGAVSISGVDNFIVADNVTKLENYAFRGSAYLSSVSVITPLKGVETLDLANVVEIGDYVFYEDSMKHIVANNLQKVGNYAFSDCRSLTEVYLPALVEMSGSYTFRYCTELKYATFGRNIKNLSSNIFNNCNKLEMITILNSNALVSVGTITSSTIGVNVTVRVPAAIYAQYKTKYEGSSTGFGNIPFENFEKFGEATEVSGATYYWNVISDVDKTAYIDYFEGTIAKNFVFPSAFGEYKVVAVSPDAMAALKDVVKVTLPANMEYLSFNTADIYNTVQELVISSTNTKFTTVDGVLYTKDGKTLLIYPMAKTAASFVVNGATEIGYRAFYGAKSLKILEFRTPVTIRDNAFENAGMTSIVFTSNTASVFAGRDILLGANVSLTISVPNSSLANYKANVLVDYSIIDKFAGV